MQINDFSRIQTEFITRVSQAVYCIMATVDPQVRPRTRLLPPC